MSAKVLFTFYPSHTRYNHGIALLSRLCKDRGIEVNLHLIEDKESFLQKINETRYDFICASTTTRHDIPKLFLALKPAHEQGNKILIGGVNAPSLNGIPIPVCRGEGETLPDYVLHGDDRLFREKMICADLNSLPLPDYELFKDYPFNRGYGTENFANKQIPYYSSRGCPFKCSFCLIQKQKMPVRIRTKVQEDLTELTGRYKPDLVFMGDALLPYYSEEWRSSWGEFKFPFFALIRADMPQDILEWLIDRGMKACSFGIESGDETYRNEVLKKQLTDADLYRTVDILRKHGVHYAPFYMTGTPGETMKIRSKTFDMKERIGGLAFVWEYEEL